jgi:hypothetical protein
MRTSIRSVDADANAAIAAAFANATPARGYFDECKWMNFQMCWSACWYCSGLTCYDWRGEQECYGTECLTDGQGLTLVPVPAELELFGRSHDQA